ncbi:zinc-ribbon domain-containing protein [Mycolicibacterium sp. ND9-15]|uniref:zinc-ribbon domain-containing protein n=1 Tax=Mycolicibacterium sp. ND9-15 TaxID=3042320 RepID=UPI003FA343EC
MIDDLHAKQDLGLAARYQNAIPPLPSNGPPAKRAANPADVTPCSNQQFWWICQDCSHHWRARPSNRINNIYLCPLCNGGPSIPGPRLRPPSSLCANRRRKSRSSTLAGATCRFLFRVSLHGALIRGGAWSLTSCRLGQSHIRDFSCGMSRGYPLRISAIPSR